MNELTEITHAFVRIYIYMYIFPLLWLKSDEDRLVWLKSDYAKIHCDQRGRVDGQWLRPQGRLKLFTNVQTEGREDCWDTLICLKWGHLMEIQKYTEDRLVLNFGLPPKPPNLEGAKIREGNIYFGLPPFQYFKSHKRRVHFPSTSLP